MRILFTWKFDVCPCFWLFLWTLWVVTQEREKVQGQLRLIHNSPLKVITCKEASQDKDWCFAKKGVTFFNFSREVSSSMILAIILTPIGSIYNILACIWLTFILNVGKKLDNIPSCMDPESYGTGMFPPHRSNVFAVGLRWIWWRFLKICQRVNICAST